MRLEAGDLPPCVANRSDQMKHSIRHWKDWEMGVNAHDMTEMQRVRGEGGG